MICVHLSITGKVQGVFFRKYAKDKADELMLFGWVANEGDGSVSAIVEGEENRVKDFIDWCHSGPSSAEVKKVKIDKQPYTAEFDSFEIRY